MCAWKVEKSRAAHVEANLVKGIMPIRPPLPRSLPPSEGPPMVGQMDLLPHPSDQQLRSRPRLLQEDSGSQDED